MSEMTRDWHFCDAPDGRQSVRRLYDDNWNPVEVQVGRATFTIRWDSEGRREFRRAVEELYLSVCEVQLHGADRKPRFDELMKALAKEPDPANRFRRWRSVGPGKFVFPKEISFSVQGTIAEMADLERREWVLAVEFDRAIFSASGGGDRPKRKR